MKKFMNLFVMVSFLGLVAQAQAKQSSATEKVCQQLQEKMDDDCAHYICDEQIANGTFADINECTGASDYAEYAQGACDSMPTLEDLVAEYNKKNPRAKVSCEY